MQKLDGIGAEPNQKLQAQLEDGTIVTLNLRYLGAVQRWVVDINHADGMFLSLNVVVHPNFMRTWRTTIRFGIACVATDGVDPVSLQDFESGRISLYVLNRDEVLQIEQGIFTVAAS